MSAGHVCVVVRVPEGPQSPYVTTQKGEVLVRTQVGTEPIKDRATLDRLFARGESGRRWAEAQVADVTSGLEYERNRVGLWTIPEVENGLGANVIIFRESFFDYMKQVLAVPIEGALFTPPRYSAGPGCAIVSTDDSPWYQLVIRVSTAGIVATSWTNVRDPEEGIDLGTMDSLVTRACPKHRLILEEKLGHRGDVTVTVAGVSNRKSSVRVTRHQVPIASLDESAFHDSLKREMIRSLGGLSYEPEE